jgi:hypothetical protein
MVTTHFPSNNQFQVKELSGNGHYYDEAEWYLNEIVFEKVVTIGESS